MKLVGDFLEGDYQATNKESSLATNDFNTCTSYFDNLQKITSHTIV